MPADHTDQLLPQNCLDALQHLLDLAMQTADAASAEKNHKLVLQAVREVTRLVTLIDKLTGTSKRQPAAQLTPAVAPAAKPVQNHFGHQWAKGGKKAGKNGSIESFFQENKQLIHNGKKTVGNALTTAAANPVSEQTESAAEDIRRQDKPAVLAAEETAAAQGEPGPIQSRR
jgi:DNA-directed RNA polymerase subunit K/omega